MVSLPRGWACRKNPAQSLRALPGRSTQLCRLVRRFKLDSLTFPISVTTLRARDDGRVSKDTMRALDARPAVRAGVPRDVSVTRAPDGELKRHYFGATQKHKTRGVLQPRVR